MSDELDPTGGGVDSTKIVTLVAGITALVTVVLNWLRGRREGQEKAEALMLERYRVMVADMGKAADAAKLEAAKAADAAKAESAKCADAAKAEYAAYRADTTRQIADLRERVAELVSQVHYFQLYLAQSGVKMPPKWDRRSDPSFCLDDDAPKESK